MRGATRFGDLDLIPGKLWLETVSDLGLLLDGLFD